MIRSKRKLLDQKKGKEIIMKSFCFLSLITCGLLALTMAETYPFFSINVRKPWVEHKDKYLDYYLAATGGNFTIVRAEDPKDVKVILDINIPDNDGKSLSPEEEKDMARFVDIERSKNSLRMTFNSSQFVFEDGYCGLFSDVEMSYQIDFPVWAKNLLNKDEKTEFYFDFDLDLEERMTRVYEYLDDVCKKNRASLISA